MKWDTEWFERFCLFRLMNFFILSEFSVESSASCARFLLIHCNGSDSSAYPELSTWLYEIFKLFKVHSIVRFQLSLWCRFLSPSTSPFLSLFSSAKCHRWQRKRKTPGTLRQEFPECKNSFVFIFLDINFDLLEIFRILLQHQETLLFIGSTLVPCQEKLWVDWHFDKFKLRLKSSQCSVSKQRKKEKISSKESRNQQQKSIWQWTKAEEREGRNESFIIRNVPKRNESRRDRCSDALIGSSIVCSLFLAAPQVRTMRKML